MVFQWGVSFLTEGVDVSGKKKRSGAKSLYTNARGSSGVVTPRKLWKEAFENRQGRTPSWWWLPNKPAVPPLWLVKAVLLSFLQVLIVCAPVILAAVALSFIPTGITENTFDGYGATAVTTFSNILSFLLAYAVCVVTMCSDKLAVSLQVFRSNVKGMLKSMTASVLLALVASIIFRYTIVFGEPGQAVTTPHPFLFVILSQLFGYGFGLQCGWGAYVRMCAWGDVAWKRRKFLNGQANSRFRRAASTLPKVLGFAPSIFFTGPMWAFVALLLGAAFLDATVQIEAAPMAMVSFLLPAGVLFYVVFASIRLFDTIKPVGQRWKWASWWEAFLVPEGMDAHDRNDWRGSDSAGNALLQRTGRSLSDATATYEYAS